MSDVCPSQGLLHSVAFEQHMEHSIRKEEVILHRQQRVLQERIHFPDPTSPKHSVLDPILSRYIHVVCSVNGACLFQACLTCWLLSVNDYHNKYTNCILQSQGYRRLHNLRLKL